jgi:DNA-directed RNA polymerase specialized sigma24 family protein
MECRGTADALAPVDPTESGRFRTWLHAVTRNIALRHEERRQGPRAREVTFDSVAIEPAAREAILSVVFDRSWARALVRRAEVRMRREAATDSDRRRIDLLRQRFVDGLSIKDIAVATSEDAARLHKEYARVRKTFKWALRREISDHDGRSPTEVEAECARLLSLL